MHFEPDRLLLWIVLLPLFGAVINGLAARFSPSRQAITAVGVGSVALSFLLCCYFFVRLAGARIDADEAIDAKVVYTAFEWFGISVGELRIPIHARFVFDALSGLMTLVVTGVGLLIHIYSTGYMKDDPSYARFFSYLNLFTASMLILVLASNLPLMFVGWEGVGLCSYLLIGFWWENPAYAAAGRKAFVVNRIGDFGVLLGMFLLVASTRSFEFSEINENSIRLLGNIEYGHTQLQITIATAGCLLLFLGCAGKSAQIPLYVWLPDAMAGPTPVSALIHAATMVTAGVYLCCRLSEVFARAPAAMAVIAVVGTLTALLAASIALFQHQIKRILAYSTVSQLGFMFAAVGAGAFAGGFFHVFTHAFFKACLFLGAGSVMHAVHAHGDADIRQLGGLRRYLPRTHWTFAVSCAAIAGVPLFSGFFSKDDILLGAFTAGHTWTFAPWLRWPIFVVLALTAAMTAFYMFRLYFRTFWGEYRGGPHVPIPPPRSGLVTIDPVIAPAEGVEPAAEVVVAPAPTPAPTPHYEEPHESPSSITIPLAILGIGAIVAGYLGLPHWLGHGDYTFWTRWLAPVVHSADVHVGIGTGFAVMAVGTLAALTGIWIAYTMYVQDDGIAEERLMAASPGWYRLIYNKWGVDELYEVFPLGFVRWLARFSSNLDKVLVDGLLTRVTSMSVQVASYAFTRVQNGVVYVYGAVLVLGIAALGWWFLMPHPRLAAAAQDRQVRAEVGPGLGYAYRWDFESDGEYDTPWGEEETHLERAYENESFREGLLGVQAPRHEGEEIRVRADDWTVLDDDLFGAEWEKLPEGIDRNDPDAVAAARGDANPPALKFDPETSEIIVRPNDAEVRVRGNIVSERETRVAAGEAIQIGMATFRVGGRVRLTVQVRNAFGAVATDSEDLSIIPGRRAQRAQLQVGGAP